MSNKASLEQKLRQANEEYRLTGKGSSFSDVEYDYLKSLAGTKEEALGVSSNRNKQKLPVKMASLLKLKTQRELKSWFRQKRLPASVKIALSPKFDGVALLVEFKDGKMMRALTRGDGTLGQDVTRHWQGTALANLQLPKGFQGCLIGEALMPLKTFKEKYAKEFKNPRNMVAGLLSRKEASEQSRDLHFIAFAAHGKKFTTVQEEWGFCNQFCNRHFSYRLYDGIFELAELSNERLAAFLNEEKSYLCDGLVLKLNDHQWQKDLGREKSSLNPAFARAWKPESTKLACTKILGLSWQVSRFGRLKPVALLQAVTLDGVTISRVTANNAKYVKENGIHVGAHLSLIRSGAVIPKIQKILLPVEGDLPQACLSCQFPLAWSGVDLCCENTSCQERVIAENLFFVKTIKIRGLGRSTLERLYQSGVHHPGELFSMERKDWLALPSLQKKRAQKLFAQFQEKRVGLSVEQLQYASSCFSGLGRSRLALFKDIPSSGVTPSLEELLQREGVSRRMAVAYLAGYDRFSRWYSKFSSTQR